jgi:hypothetical protein
LVVSIIFPIFRHIKKITIMDILIVLIVGILGWIVVRQIQYGVERKRRQTKFWKNIEEFEKRNNG